MTEEKIHKIKLKIFSFLQKDLSCITEAHCTAVACLHLTSDIIRYISFLLNTQKSDFIEEAFKQEWLSLFKQYLDHKDIEDLELQMKHKFGDKWK